jgi:hypothetical protein
MSVCMYTYGYDDLQFPDDVGAPVLVVVVVVHVVVAAVYSGAMRVADAMCVVCVVSVFPLFHDEKNVPGGNVYCRWTNNNRGTWQYPLCTHCRVHAQQQEQEQEHEHEHERMS